jgi:hypothetical protein
MTMKTFRPFLDRDGGVCVHCGSNGADLVPGHRLGRGAGGSKAREVASNVIVMCWWLNNHIETHADVRAAARLLGWSLESWQKPSEEPFWNAPRQRWEQPHDDGTVTVVDRPRPERTAA